MRPRFIEISEMVGSLVYNVKKKINKYFAILRQQEPRRKIRKSAASQTDIKLITAKNQKTDQRADKPTSAAAITVIKMIHSCQPMTAAAKQLQMTTKRSAGHRHQTGYTVAQCGWVVYQYETRSTVFKRPNGIKLMTVINVPAESHALLNWVVRQFMGRKLVGGIIP